MYYEPDTQNPAEKKLNIEETFTAREKFGWSRGNSVQQIRLEYNFWVSRYA